MPAVAMGAGRSLLLRLHHFLATIRAGGRHVMAQMHFTGGRLDRDRCRGEEVVGAMHTALGWGLFVLLDSHEKLQ
jgi:hypothetical protein